MKERIAAGAFRLFMQYGIKTISMDDIALNLGISKKTIYKWFENKDQLVEEALTTYLDSITNECIELHTNALEEFCQSISTIMKKLLQFHPSFFYDLKKYHNQAYQVWREYKQQQVIQLFKTNFSQGIATGLYRSDVNPEIAARLYTGQLEVIFNSDLFPAGEFNMLETYQHNLKNFIMGIVTPQGNKVLQEYMQKNCCIAPN